MKLDSDLLALRAANPVPAAAQIDDEELFARIVALPTERLRRTPNRRLVVAVVLAVAAIATSTAVGVDRWLSGAVKPDVTRQEYRDAQSLLALPPGETWPALPIPANTMTSAGGGGGHAVAIAMTRWECYWASAIRSGNVAAQHRAGTVLEGLLADHVVIAPNGAPEDWQPASPPTFPYAVFADDGGFQYTQRLIRAAAAGDVSGIAQSCRANS